VILEALVFVVALVVGGSALFALGIMVGERREAEKSVEGIWDTAILLGSYGEQLRQKSRETGIPVHELAKIELPQRRDRACPVCGLDTP
jgi:hypothetical protein